MRTIPIAAALLLAAGASGADPPRVVESADVCDHVGEPVEPPLCEPYQLRGREELTVIDRTRRPGVSLAGAAACHARAGKRIAVNRRFLERARRHGVEISLAATTCRDGATLYVLDDLRRVEVPSPRCPAGELLHVHVPAAVVVPGWAERVFGAGGPRFHSTRSSCGPARDPWPPRRGRGS